MDHVPISGLDELEAHLQQIVQNPETPLNAKLFDEVELQLNGMISCSFFSIDDTSVYIPFRWIFCIY